MSPPPPDPATVVMESYQIRHTFPPTPTLQRRLEGVASTKNRVVFLQAMEIAITPPLFLLVLVPRGRTEVFAPPDQ